jgi:hypothetical protein
MGIHAPARLLLQERSHGRQGGAASAGPSRCLPWNPLVQHARCMPAVPLEVPGHPTPTWNPRCRAERACWTTPVRSSPADVTSVGAHVGSLSAVGAALSVVPKERARLAGFSRLLGAGGSRLPRLFGNGSSSWSRMRRARPASGRSLLDCRSACSTGRAFQVRRLRTE